MMHTKTFLYSLGVVAQLVAADVADHVGSKSDFVFNRIASFPICSQIDKACNTDTETVAEIVAVSDDGMTLVYTDSELKQAGFVDITDPAKPKGLGVVEVGGEPTSCGVLDKYALVAVNTGANYTNPGGLLKVIEISTKKIVRELDLGGQPDAVAISPDKKYAAIAIENERDEDLVATDGAPPQMPAGFLVIVDTDGDVSSWKTRQVTLTNLTGLTFPTDPEPEFVSINSKNVAVVTLQENNAIVLVDLASGSVTSSFSAGKVDLTQVDTAEEGVITQNTQLSQVPREPDGVTWIGDDMFATADEGDLAGGSRGWTIYNTAGLVVYTSGNTMEHIVTQVGQYPEERSKNKGNEPENVFFGKFGDSQFLFVISERSSLVFVYVINDPMSPTLLQVLPAGLAPEGGVAIPSRDLVVVASEKDGRGDKFRSVLNIYKRSQSKKAFPTLYSGKREDGTYIPFSALSGLAAGVGTKSKTLYTIEDSFYKKNRILEIGTDSALPQVNKEIRIVDTDDVFAVVKPYGNFSADKLAAMINEDKTVNIDPEGIAVTDTYMIVASEGSGTVYDVKKPIQSLNFLFKVDYSGKILEVITLPDEVNAIQLRFGFEGVAVDGDVAYVTFQRAWGKEANPRLGMYDMKEKSWTFAYYPLDTPESQNGGWVGLSDIAPLGDKQFLVLERDNQGSLDAAIKRIYKVDLSSVKEGETVKKTLYKDLMPVLKKEGRLNFEKVEGLTVMADNSIWIVTDNDGVDDNSGEILLLNVGKYDGKDDHVDGKDDHDGHDHDGKDDHDATTNTTEASADKGDAAASDASSSCPTILGLAGATITILM